jgi:hypothetical protein
MEPFSKGVLSAFVSSLIVGVSYWNNLFYRTALADPRWPESVQRTAFLFSLLIALVISIAWARSPRKRLLYLLGRTCIACGVLLVASLFLYVAVEFPLVSHEAEMRLLDMVWRVTDVAAVTSVIACVSFASLAAGSSIWDSFK